MKAEYNFVLGIAIGIVLLSIVFFLIIYFVKKSINSLSLEQKIKRVEKEKEGLIQKYHLYKQQQKNLENLSYFFELSPYKAITRENYVLCRDDFDKAKGKNTLLSFFRIQSEDLAQLTNAQLKGKYDSFTAFNRMYLDDYKINAMSFPLDCKIQKEYWQKKREKAKTFEAMENCSYALNRISMAEHSLVHREYFLVLNAINEEEMKKAERQVLFYTNNFDMERIDDPEELTQILFKLFNQGISVA